MAVIAALFLLWLFATGKVGDYIALFKTSAAPAKPATASGSGTGNVGVAQMGQKLASMFNVTGTQQ